MNQDHETWVYCCLIFSILIGIFLIFIQPILGLGVTIFALLIIGVAYIQATRNQRPQASTIRHMSPSDEDSRPIFSSEPKPELVQIRVLPENSTKSSPLNAVPPQPTIPDGKQEEINLHQRIAVLEKRVQSLRQQLAEEPSSGEDPTNQRPEQPEVYDSTSTPEDLSEVAIRHLLEALDEKLAKGSISQPLYDRLRDKYKARLEKAKKSRKAPSKWGTKEASTGE